VFHDYVEDLEDYYKKSHIVISPIFIGSGMKVKIAEALMFGKIIIGTQLSFQGYKINNADCYICNTKEEFVNKIIDLQYLLLDTDLNYSESSRKTYLDLYSDLNINNYFLPVNNFIIDNENE
jgi:glycosyltransferase involved in cell wall biosynthesis